jgi:uncharacterized protein YukE
MAQIGGDLQSMADLKQTFDSQAGAVGQVITTLTNKITTVVWEGSAATTFKGEWDAIHKRNLQKLQTTLTDAARVVQGRIEALQAADQA